MNGTRSNITMGLFSFVPYLFVAWGCMAFVNGKASEFWTALGALVAIRLFFSIIETLGSGLSWRLCGKKILVDKALRFLRENNFPKREHAHDDSLAYFGRIEDGGKYDASIRTLAKEMTFVMTICEHTGILAGMRMYSAADAALDMYSPKSESPIFGSTPQTNSFKADEQMHSLFEDLAEIARQHDVRRVPSTQEDAAMMSPNDKYIEQFSAAASEGAVLELKLRLLVDKIPELQNFAHAPRLEAVENELIKHLGEALTAEEKATFTQCRQLRNKILHCNFSVARETLANMGAEPQSAGVKKVDLSGLSTGQMMAKMEGAIAGEEDTFKYVEASPTTTPGSVFGWLLEVGEAGDLMKAVGAFRAATAIVDRLAMANYPAS